MSGVRWWQQISRAPLHRHGVIIPFLGHFMHTLAAHWLNWLVLGGTKTWHRCLISLAVKTLPNQRTDVAVVVMKYGFVLWAGVKGGVFAERNCWFIEAPTGSGGGGLYAWLYTAMTWNDVYVQIVKIANYLINELLDYLTCSEPLLPIWVAETCC